MIGFQTSSNRTNTTEKQKKKCCQPLQSHVCTPANLSLRSPDQLYKLFNSFYRYFRHVSFPFLVHLFINFLFCLCGGLSWLQVSFEHTLNLCLFVLCNIVTCLSVLTRLALILYTSNPCRVVCELTLTIIMHKMTQ